jgi:glycerophosphoryl diester phosphodiesterase
MDVRMTSDEYLVLMHGDNVSRTINEVKALRIKPRTWMSVSEVKEALLFINGRALADLDVKSADPEILVGIIERAESLNTAYVDVSDVEEALELRDLNPEIAR